MNSRANASARGGDGYHSGMILPNDPSELAALLRQIEAHASNMAAELDRTAFEQRPESVREAVDRAVSSLYFYGSNGDADRALEHIVALLAPEISKVLIDDGADAAYRVLHPEDEP